MNATITVELPDDVKAVLDMAAKEEGLTEMTFAARALKDYLFLRRLRKLRQKMLANLDQPFTDEEIFEIVS